MCNVCIEKLRFEWDSKTASSNAKKHGVTFPEASSVFYDEWAVQYDDPDHSDEEERFILLGTSTKLRVVVVCHCFRQSDSAVRFGSPIR
ncbi:MAG: BrnT family toxin [Lysobacterales bacterium]